MHYMAVTVQGRPAAQSVYWYVTGWSTPFDCSLLAVCRTQALAEAMRDALMDGEPPSDAGPRKRTPLRGHRWISGM